MEMGQGKFNVGDKVLYKPIPMDHDKLFEYDGALVF
jgi:hypothetical protein